MHGQKNIKLGTRRFMFVITIDDLQSLDQPILRKLELLKGTR